MFPSISQSVEKGENYYMWSYYSMKSPLIFSSFSYKI